MKDNKFYLFVITQVFILFLFVGQCYLIDSFGKSFKIYIDHPYEYYDGDLISNVYVEHDISEISNNVWGIDDELTFNDLVYVKLEKDEKEVFIVVDVADHKLTSQNNNQTVLKAYFTHDYMGKYYVDYRLKNEINVKYFDDIDRKQPIIAHYKRAPWGQFKLLGMENIE